MGMVDIDWETVKKLYTEGATDRKISRYFKCDIKKIFNWRHKNGLPANYIGRHKKELIGGVIVGAGAVAAAAVIYKAVKKRKENKKDNE
jgi:hypothetical protein